MKRVLFLISIMLTAELALAQTNSPFFTNRSATDSRIVPDSTGAPLIDPSVPNDSKIELEAVIAESFFRRLWSGINNKDAIRKQMTYSRFNLNDDQAQVLQQSINDWMHQTSADAGIRRDQMCAYWNSQSGSNDSAVIADAALGLYESLEPSKARVGERLQGLIEDIESKLGEDFIISLMNELDKDYDRRKDVKYSSWASSIRGRNNAIEQLQFTCGGEQ